jgi:YD repeat-containing protein
MELAHSWLRVVDEHNSETLNGTPLSGGNRTPTWDAEYRPTSSTSGSVTERSTYDGDGARRTCAVNGVPTVSLAGVWKEVSGGATTVSYPCNGTLVAMREGSTVTTRHGDHPSLPLRCAQGCGAGQAWAVSAWRPARAGHC